MTKSSRSYAVPQKLAATNERSFRTFLLMQQFAAEDVGARIAQARNESGMTQEELAEIAPFSKRSLQDYEAGTTIPYKHLRFLAKILKRPVDWFLHGDQEEQEIQSRVLEELAALRADLADLARRLPEPK